VKERKKLKHTRRVSMEMRMRRIIIIMIMEKIANNSLRKEVVIQCQLDQWLRIKGYQCKEEGLMR